MADGTYTGGVIVYGPWVGRGGVSLQGNTSTPANCVIAPSSGAAVQVGRQSSSTVPPNAGARLAIGGFKLTTTNSQALFATEGATVLVNAAMEYGNCGTSTQITASRRGEIIVAANYVISGNASNHLSAVNNAVVACTSLTITLSGSPVFSGGFARSQRVSTIIANGNTFSGATGSSSKRYATLTGGVIDVAGAGTSYFPGDTAGTDDGTGIYA